MCFYIRFISREISKISYKVCCEPEPRNMSVLPRLAEEQGHFFLTAISRIELVSTSELRDKSWRGYSLLAHSMAITFLTQVSFSLSLEKANFKFSASPRVKVWAFWHSFKTLKYKKLLSPQWTIYSCESIS